MSIYTVNGNPVKYGNKWLATDGGTPSGELPPYDSSDAGKALVVNNEGDNVEWQTVGSSITVDQTYDSTSSNAQSGTAVAEAISTKQDTIDDLSDIRSGAEAGATAVQPSDLATVATTGDYDDLLNKPTIPAAQVNSDWAASSGVAAILNKPTLAAVATSGSYNDLTDKPTIPAAVTVDQHYSASSTNPQSGTAVAEALQTVPDELPSLTSNAGKVLKVNSGATGVEWATESGGTTYTAGTGIDITGTTISADTTVLATQQDLSGKQDVLTAGNMISISSNTVGVSTTSGITDIQMVNALPANPVATILYLIPAT